MRRERAATAGAPAAELPFVRTAHLGPPLDVWRTPTTTQPSPRGAVTTSRSMGPETRTTRAQIDAAGPNAASTGSVPEARSSNTGSLASTVEVV